VNAHPSQRFVSVGMTALVKLFGWEFFDKLAAQKPIVVQSALDTCLMSYGGGMMSVGGTAYTVLSQSRKESRSSTFYPRKACLS
jgi:hypothetical protein